LKIINDLIGFDWDSGNRNKNWLKHKVIWRECEEVFFNNPLFIIPDVQHSQSEPRYTALGKTNRKRLLTIIFTVRNEKIRVISARDMHKKERKFYNEKAEEDSKV